MERCYLVDAHLQEFCIEICGLIVVTFRGLRREIFIHVLREEFVQKLRECRRDTAGHDCTSPFHFLLLLFFNTSSRLSVVGLAFSCETRLGNSLAVLTGSSWQRE